MSTTTKRKPKKTAQAERMEKARNILQQVPEAFPERGMVSVRTLKAFALLVETVLEVPDGE